MRKTICLLLMICLTTAMFSMAEGELEGRPWTNPELPGNLPDERPAVEENYYLYVNDGLHRNAYAQEEDSMQTRVQKEVKESIWSLVDTGESTEAQVLRILTFLIMDGEARKREGMEPLMTRVRRVRDTRTTQELSDLCREEGFLMGSPYAVFWLEQSQQDPDLFALTVQMERPVPQAEIPEGLEEGSEFPDELPLDTGRVEDELRQLGCTPEEAAQMTARILAFQKELQQESVDSVEDGFFMGDSRSLTASEIRDACTPLYDQMVSQGLFRGDDMDSALFQTAEFPALRNLQRLYTEDNLEVFQAIVCLYMLRYAAEYLDPATYARTNGISGEPDLKEAAFRYMKDHAKDLTEQAYMDAFVPPKQREQVQELAEEYKDALAERMAQCPWLSEESRKNAAEKASMLRILVVTSGERIDYGPLLEKLKDGSMNLLEAAVQYDLTVMERLRRLAGTPYDRGCRSLYTDSMLETNAVYEAGKNAFYMMAGMLRPDMYDGSSRETLLATIGQTIGHEMGHGFDANGVQGNGSGGAQSILTEEDQDTFRTKVQHFAQSLSRMELADGVSVNGTYVINEAIADLTGLRLTLDLARKTEGFDYDLFFRSLARKYYRSFQTREAALNDYSSNFHPAPYIRINFTFAQTDEFCGAYPSVREGTPMYIAPEMREDLW